MKQGSVSSNAVHRPGQIDQTATWDDWQGLFSTVETRAPLHLCIQTVNHTRCQIRLGFQTLDWNLSDLIC